MGAEDPLALFTCRSLQPPSSNITQTEHLARDTSVFVGACSAQTGRRISDVTTANKLQKRCTGGQALRDVLSL